MLPATVVLGDDDSQLLAEAQRGDERALDELYARYREPSRRLATSLVGDDEADDLVDEAFVRVAAQLRRGRRPTNFRAYLTTSIRNLHRDQLRRSWREEPASDQPWLLEGPREAANEPPEEYDDARAATALATLPSSWQQIVQMVEVDQRSIAEIARLLQLTPAAVSSLAYRAREGLRVAYLEQFIERDAPVAGRECARARARLSRYVRGSLAPSTARQVAGHVGTCAPCSAIVHDLERVNSCFHGTGRPS